MEYKVLTYHDQNCVNYICQFKGESCKNHNKLRGRPFKHSEQCKQCC